MDYIIKINSEKEYEEASSFLKGKGLRDVSNGYYSFNKNYLKIYSEENCFQLLSGCASQYEGKVITFSELKKIFNNMEEKEIDINGIGWIQKKDEILKPLNGHPKMSYGEFLKEYGELMNQIRKREVAAENMKQILCDNYEGDHFESFLNGFIEGTKRDFK